MGTWETIDVDLYYPKSSQFGFGCISWNHSKSSKSQLFVFGPVSYPHQPGASASSVAKPWGSGRLSRRNAGLAVCLHRYTYSLQLLYYIITWDHDHIIYFYTSVTYCICSDDYVILEHFVIFGRIHFFPGFWTQKWWIWGPWMDRSVHGSWQAFFRSQQLCCRDVLLALLISY